MVYIVISLSTALHTAWGAATTMQGDAPSGGNDLIIWWVQGALFAIAIDVSMLALASVIRNGQGSRAHAITFCVVALLSTYTQLLYAWSHTSQLTPGAGMPSEWVAQLQGLIDLRILILPLALPTIALLYTLSGLGAHASGESAPQVDAPPLPVQQHLHVHKVEPERIAAPQVPALPQISHRTGASGGARTGATDGRVTQLEDALFVAQCPKCGRTFEKASEVSARNALTAHMKRCAAVPSEVSVTHEDQSRS